MSLTTSLDRTKPTDLALPEPTQDASKPAGPTQRSGTQPITSLLGRAPAPPAAGDTPSERASRRSGELTASPPPAAAPQSAPSLPPTPSSHVAAEGTTKAVPNETQTTPPPAPETGEKTKKSLNEVAEEGQKNEKEITEKQVDATVDSSKMNIVRSTAERAAQRWKTLQESLGKLV